ncbi:hypothetical protein T439DRAFT_282338 [Meredithblackwellia eburnea MCA 4105]
MALLNGGLRRFGSPPRLILVALFASALLLVPTFFVLSPSFDTPDEHNALWAAGSVNVGQVGRSLPGGVAVANKALDQMEFTGPEAERDRKVAELLMQGGVIMPKLKNETLKAELGRSTWKLLHTMAARFPTNPTDNERDTFKEFIYLFSRLYPCGECAAEFQALLKKYPPQTSSRSAASLHLCHLHNMVNARLGKPEFDCECSANLVGVYDCGCGDVCLFSFLFCRYLRWVLY